MQEIIAPIDKNILEQELTNDLYIRPTNNGGNQLFVVDCHTAPNVLKEIGRLREESFRAAGGGTGKDCDLDEFDYGSSAYKQLIVWHPEDKEIIGGYRYIKTIDARQESGDYHLATTEIYEFSEKMKNYYFLSTIELGRSFVQPKYQPSAENRKGLFSLDNLWDGLGALIVLHPEVHFFFGKVTMYTHFNKEARDLILSFMHHYFPDNENLIKVEHPVNIEHDTSQFIKSLSGLDYKEGHHLLNSKVREVGENIPPLFNSYMNTSPTMKTFPTCINHHFGDVEETGIMVTIKDIYESKKDRHVNSFLKYLETK
ncbi:MAG: GNAT family N-acetyltransferase [Bacteroidota bacterium]|nr:GNAT family N-acetyltransferase [Bacteroidota bacterium]